MNSIALSQLIEMLMAIRFKIDQDAGGHPQFVVPPSYPPEQNLSGYRTYNGVVHPGAGTLGTFGTY